MLLFNYIINVVTFIIIASMVKLLKAALTLCLDVEDCLESEAASTYYIMYVYIYIYIYMYIYAGSIDQSG